MAKSMKVRRRYSLLLFDVITGNAIEERVFTTTSSAEFIISNLNPKFHGVILRDNGIEAISPGLPKDNPWYRESLIKG